MTKIKNIFHAPVQSVQQGDHNCAFSSEDTADLQQDPDDNSNVIYDDEPELVGDGGFEDYPCEIGPAQGIVFRVDADNPIDVFLLDMANYETWRNSGEFESSYEAALGVSFLKREFWPDETGEYVLVVSNRSSDDCTVSVHLISMDA